MPLSAPRPAPVTRGSEVLVRIAAARAADYAESLAGVPPTLLPSLAAALGQVVERLELSRSERMLGLRGRFAERSVQEGESGLSGRTARVHPCVGGAIRVGVPTVPS